LGLDDTGTTVHGDLYWLVVWNMDFILPFSWECHHPNFSELNHFSEG
jgi:hypothetical protein